MVVIIRTSGDADGGGLDAGRIDGAVGDDTVVGAGGGGETLHGGAGVDVIQGQTHPLTPDVAEIQAMAAGQAMEGHPDLLSIAGAQPFDGSNLFGPSGGLMPGGSDDAFFGGAGFDGVGYAIAPAVGATVGLDADTHVLHGSADADTFHAFDHGTDLVLDFDRAHGDRVVVNEGATWTASQQGGDVVVDLTGGGKVILVGVQMSSLTDGWITEI